MNQTMKPANITQTSGMRAAPPQAARAATAPAITVKMTNCRWVFSGLAVPAASAADELGAAPGGVSEEHPRPERRTFAKFDSVRFMDRTSGAARSLVATECK